LSVARTALYISRFRLFHKGYLSVVKHILGENSHLIFAIGAAQQPPCWDNPFSGKERAEMIVRTLSHEGLVRRAKVVQLDETGITYDEWTALVHRTCPPFDMVYSNSDLVRLLLGRSGYQSEAVPVFAIKEYSFDYLRERMVQKLDWEHLVPQPVAEFIKERGLDQGVRELKRKL